jgi:prophage regulatory protein
MALRQMLRAEEVLKRTGLGRSTMYRRIAAGTFPQPQRLGPNSIRFYEDEVQKWIDQQGRGTDSARGRRMLRARTSKNAAA